MVRAAIEGWMIGGGPNNYETRTRPIWFTNSVNSPRSSSSASGTSIEPRATRIPTGPVGFGLA
jgi:hypothetical protein